MHRPTAALASAALSLGLLAAVPQPAEAVVADAPCGDVEVVYARGSGQRLGAAEADRFRTQLRDRIQEPLTMRFYEVGTEAIGGYQYPAVAVGDPRTLVGAFTTAGEANEYGASVDAGAAEMLIYLMERSTACPESRFVLGGYSQGAQVVGETLGGAQYFMAPNIDFVALWGDPKLYLPEGIGWRPPACRGEEFSPWRRVVPDCRTDGGILQPRVPYVPDVFEQKTGLWCNNDDFTCGSSVWGKMSGHLRYAEEGDGIDLAALEAAERIRASLPPEKAQHVDVSRDPGNVGTAGLDVVFLIDTTGSMSGRIGQARVFAASVAEQIASMRGRVALATYRDAGDVYTARIETQFSSDLTGFQSALSTMRASGGGDTPEALMHALMVTMNGVEWTPGATKAIVVLTDAGYHNPDGVDGSTPLMVAARALEIDPVNVYPVVPTWVAPQYAEIAELTTGQVVVDTGDTVAALSEALMRIQTRPVALLRNAEYAAASGEPITFDASTSYSSTSPIAGYSWDIDGDGTYDAQTTEPVYRHTYGAPFEGLMQVRVTTEDGGVSSASALVHIDQPEPTLPGAPSVQVTEIPGQSGAGEVLVEWTPADDLATLWGLSINGLPIGMTDAASVTVADVDRGEDTVFGVVGLTADGSMGARGEAVLPASAAVLYSGGSLNLTNQFTLAGAGGDLHVDGDFSCNSDVRIGGDLLVSGDVYLTNHCAVQGSVHAGGDVRMDSTPSIGGDVRAVGDLRFQSTASIGGHAELGGTFYSTDGRTIDELVSTGAIAGGVLEGAVVDQPRLMVPTPVGDPTAGTGAVTWAKWMNVTAAANGAPSWSAGLKPQPGCVMAPWASSVNGDTVRVSTDTTVDGRSASSGCRTIALQGMQVELTADLTLYADGFAAINGMRVTSGDGEPHALRIVSPDSAEATCRQTGISLSAGTVADPAIRFTLQTRNKMTIQGPSSFTGKAQAGCLSSSGAVSITAP